MIVSFGPHFFALSAKEGMGGIVSGAVTGVVCAYEPVLINRISINTILLNGNKYNSGDDNSRN